MDYPVAIIFIATKLSRFVRCEEPPTLVFLDRETFEIAKSESRKFAESEAGDRRFLVTLFSSTMNDVEPGNLILIRGSSEVWKLGSDHLFEESSWDEIAEYFDVRAIEFLFRLTGAKTLRSIGWDSRPEMVVRFDPSLVVRKQREFLKCFAQTFRRGIEGREKAMS